MSGNYDRDKYMPASNGASPPVSISYQVHHFRRMLPITKVVRVGDDVAKNDDT